jgi:rSAM/selenodomain-associated transferase 1
MTDNPLRALLIFTKSPVAGMVKTRLSPPLSPEAAAALYRCMLVDTLAHTAALGDLQRFIFFAGQPGDAAQLRGLAPDALVCPQEGSDLGERLHAAFSTVFAAGYAAAAVVGSDAPHLPPFLINEAFARLVREDVDAVCGPSSDGGYYLLAMKRLQPTLLTDIPWGSERVLAASLARAASAGLRIDLLPEWYDLDTPADLKRLAAAPQDGLAPLTRGFLASLPADTISAHSPRTPPPAGGG